MFDDDFNFLEDDFMDEPDTSSPSINKGSIPSLKGNGDSSDSKKVQETVEKNKPTPSNPDSNNGKVNPNERVGAPKGIDNGNQFKNAGNIAKMAGGNLDDPEQLKNAGKDAIKPLVRKGIQTATGGAVGTDPITGKIIDKAVDKIADNPAIDKVIDETAKKIKNQKKKAIIMLIMPYLPFLCGFFLIVIIVGYLFMPVFGYDELDDSKNIYEKQFYDKLDSMKNIYEQKCGTTMDAEIISAAILYDQIINISNLEIEYKDDEGNIEDFESMMPNIDFYGKTDDISTLLDELYPELDFSSTEEADVAACKPDYAGFKSYLINDYMKNNYKNANNAISDYEQAAEEILAMSGQYVIENAYQGSYYCSGVIVTNPDGTTKGTYDLETYVAGVVQAEGYTTVVGMEALKAQAILARSYVLYQTDNCKKSIESSQRKQVFEEPTGTEGIEAAKATEGLIMQYANELMLVMYDSFYKGGSYSCDDSGCSTTYTKLPNNETHVVHVSPKYTYMIAGGHGKGMSQVASYDLADQGYSYDQILYTFFSPGTQIAKMTSLLTGATYTSSSAPPTNQEVIQQRVSTGTDPYYNSSMGLISQCPWYAKSRAAEIIAHSDMPEDIKNAAIKSISGTGGNGGNVVARVDGEIFQKSYDYTQVRPGSLVSWSSSSADGPNCHSYGHVAVIEQVNEDGTVLVSDGWNGGGVNASNTWQNIRYRLRTVTIDYLAGYKSNGCSYTFAGYAYLLG